MISQISEMLSYAFIQRALIVGVFLSIASALVGVPLVLRRKSMLGDGLSHVSFGAVAFAMFIGLAPAKFAVIIAILAALLILQSDKKSKSSGDSRIAVMSAGALAIGMLFLSLQKGNTIDPNSYLFGSILLITQSDLWLSVAVSILAILLYGIFYKQIFAVSFDEEFARAIGIKAGFYDVVFAVICSVIVVLGMKLSGALLISAFIVFPCLSAMQIAKSFKSVVVCSVLFGLLSFLVGFVVSYLLATPAGATIAICELFFYLLAFMVAKIK
jgi:zinc transport system permease protein